MGGLNEYDKHLKERAKLLKDNLCTWFLPKISKLDARKKWIVSSISPKGHLIIDEGAIILNMGKKL